MTVYFGLMGGCESVDEAVGEIIGTGFARVHFNAIIVVIIFIIDIAEMTANRARIVSTASLGFFPPLGQRSSPAIMSTRPAVLPCYIVV
eukprot:scaffold6017_cov78-Cyclotella_meneghiniana.AAC.2